MFFLVSESLFLSCRAVIEASQLSELSHLGICWADSAIFLKVALRGAARPYGGHAVQARPRAGSRVAGAGPGAPGRKRAPSL